MIGRCLEYREILFLWSNRDPTSCEVINIDRRMYVHPSVRFAMIILPTYLLHRVKSFCTNSGDNELCTPLWSSPSSISVIVTHISLLLSGWHDTNNKYYKFVCPCILWYFHVDVFVVFWCKISWANKGIRWIIVVDIWIRLNLITWYNYLIVVRLSSLLFLRWHNNSWCFRCILMH